MCLSAVASLDLHLLFCCCYCFSVWFWFVSNMCREKIFVSRFCVRACVRPDTFREIRLDCSNICANFFLQTFASGQSIDAQIYDQINEHFIAYISLLCSSSIICITVKNAKRWTMRRRSQIMHWNCLFRAQFDGTQHTIYCYRIQIKCVVQPVSLYVISINFETYFLSQSSSLI